MTNFRSTNPIQAPKRTFRIKWAEVAAFTAVAAVSVLATLAVVNVALGPATSPAEPTTPACATDGGEATSEGVSSNRATDCFWNAETQGNGFGNSFYTDAEGNTYYLPVAVEDTPEYKAVVECVTQFKGYSRDAIALATELTGYWAAESKAKEEGAISNTTYGEYVITDNLQPMQDRYDYLLTTFCPED